MLYIYFNGFWSGFHDGTNAVNDIFFIKLMSKVYDTYVSVTFNINLADVLIENTQVIDSLLGYKKWKHTYLFSGESYLNPNAHKYSCVLYGNRNHKNIVNVPLYIPYYISSFDESYITYNKTREITTVPKNQILVIISNSNGHVRNNLIELLEQHFNVTFAGNYKNNIGGSVKSDYNSAEFRTFVGQYKFIISMENSEEDTYITEKITHGLLSGSVPIYWGSKRVTDYFNSERFIEVKDVNEIPKIIDKMKNITDTKWLEMVNKRPFTEYGSKYTLNTIAKHIRNLIYSKPYHNLSQTYFLCNKEFEPERYYKLKNMCNTLALTSDNYEFISSTYKHTITETMMKKYVKEELVLRARNIPMKKAEISLYLNFKEALEDIVKTYKDGIFLILESDAFVLPTIGLFDKCIQMLVNKNWSAINIGGESFNVNEIPWSPTTIYRRGDTSPNIKLLLGQAKEDLNQHYDDIRFIRKFHTRCTDSQLWSYKGCVEFLNYMNTETNYGVPLDYYICHKAETDITFKYYWSIPSFFDQASNRGMDISTIQSDKN
jgi:hypothetical protein